MSHSPLTAANFEETGKARAAWCRDGYPLREAFPLLPHLTLPCFISLRCPPAHFAPSVALTLIKVGKLTWGCCCSTRCIWVNDVLAWWWGGWGQRRGEGLVPFLFSCWSTYFKPLWILVTLERDSLLWNWYYTHNVRVLIFGFQSRRQSQGQKHSRATMEAWERIYDRILMCIVLVS